MKTTMYELLGLVKDGKAPKRIRQIFNDGFKEEYILDNEGWYETIDKTTKMNIFKVDRLNSVVEILEEEKKLPEKIPLNYVDDRKPEEVYEYLRCSYNQLIDYLKSKGE